MVNRFNFWRQISSTHSRIRVMVFLETAQIQSISWNTKKNQARLRKIRRILPEKNEVYHNDNSSKCDEKSQGPAQRSILFAVSRKRILGHCFLIEL